MRDRLVEMRFDADDRDPRDSYRLGPNYRGRDHTAVAFFFQPGDAPDVATLLRRAADELDAIYSEVRPL
jgi:hypothetical protein